MCCVKSLQSCRTLCDPMDCSLQGSSVHEILQARILECKLKTREEGGTWLKRSLEIAKEEDFPSNVLFCSNHEKDYFLS